jgi:hypothetical protein
MNHKSSGANAIALIMGFPDFYTVPDGGWHITVCKKLGLVKNDLIPGGHAAMAFIHKDTGQIEYADFGRYVSPKGLARLRTKTTDPDVHIDITATFDDEGRITNKEEILRYFDSNRDMVQSVGTMFASFCDAINYEKAKEYVHHLERQGSIPYNVFGKENLNCARFVRQALLRSVTDKRIYKKLRYTPEPTPTPLGSIIWAASPSEYYRIWQGEISVETRSIYQLMWKYFFNNSPNEYNIRFKTGKGGFHVPDPLPEYPEAQWLGGFACGAWFHIEQPDHLRDDRLFRIRKVTEKNQVIFDHLFEVNDPSFTVEQPYEIIHDCTALFCSAKQEGKRFKFDYRMPF